MERRPCTCPLKTANNDAKIVGVDPHGSVMAQPDSLNVRRERFEVEGIGHLFVPGSHF